MTLSSNQQFDNWKRMWILLFPPLLLNSYHSSLKKHPRVQKRKKIRFFEQAVRRPPLLLLLIDRPWPRPAPLTDSSGRALFRQRHGGVFVRVCGTVLCGEYLIEVPQLIIVPPFWGWSARREGAARKGNNYICIYSLSARTVPVCGWVCIDIAIVVCHSFSPCGGWDGVR